MARKHPKKRHANLRKVPAAVLDRTARVMEVPPDFTGGMVHVELSGNREAVVEGNCAILEYDETIIRLHAGKYTLRFTGRGLSMRNLRKDSAIIEGYILSVEYL